ncbi:CPBP family intramembrane glutamic endopeptidase [Candidatus Lucifugimonas marina]|uniref:CPBP family intramembrane metalloprotease n=1 Tax=Candidatus Lucifugimonas marina TaxID=3038979 RepID=A0AAJ6CU87_9CHLR|nr:CPBP family intramembrane metalloprotease [SAR202 cluster bacterium JH702]MDG0869810.1 CPBP family intramembrane metalloprotease [SAR202 cluster bacterium JH639]WFG34537.1 CPBP family intramembrane metalloprotease [SAR202 cluster bacterium JH545]WFG38465.1 CPBP family intramembrane metalloprotease [SAR202 cluster bacterium JH1073]
MLPPQPPTPTNNERWQGIDLPTVNWGPLDVVIAVIVTMLVVISILSLSGAFGTSVGYDTTVTSPVGYYVGLLATALSLVLLRLFRYPLWPIIAALTAGVGITAISYQFGTDIGNGTAEFIGVPVGIIAATAMSGAFAATGIAFSVVRYREPFAALGFVKTNGIKPYLFAVAMWLVGLSVLMFWVQALYWFGVDSLVPPDTAKKALDEAGGSIVVTIVLVGILGPIAEEIFFRGYVLPGLVKKFGIGWALLLSSVMFGLFHIDLGAIVPTFALGLALGWVYLKTGSIWPAMFAHGLHNTVAVLIAKYVSVA